MKPLNAKRYFSFRVPINYLLIVAIFVPCAWGLAKLPYTLLTDAAVIALLYFLFFFVLLERAVGIDCPKCGGRIDSNTPWECGFCREKNKNTVMFPFVNRCQGCGAEPKAYKCHHCGELVFLGKDELKLNYACCLNLNVAPSSSAGSATLRKEAKETALHEIEMTELAAKLEQAKKRKELEKKTWQDGIQDSYDRYFAPRMGKEEFARTQRPMLEEKYRNDPDMLQKSNEIMDDWLREGM